LPEAGFIFCCFNNNYKISPQIFDVWMRLLMACPGSVLWLLGDNPYAILNLRREAAARGVAPERLVLAPRVPNEDHLARHRLADLFLDTLPVNAHATASDALWAGRPFLTCMGNTFAGRVAASLLRAVGMPELVASSLAEYEAIALSLARPGGDGSRQNKTREQSKHAAVVRHRTDNAQFGNGLHDDVRANPARRAA
jgi:protein O-GlcNAc transferase